MDISVAEIEVPGMIAWTSAAQKPTRGEWSFVVIA